MKSNIIGREAEIHTLERLLNSNRSEFIAVCGRRRIGKTFLVREFFDNQFAFAATGLAKGSMKQQLRAFCNGFPLSAGLPVPRDWFTAFQQLTVYLESLPVGRKVVFLDELPWFDTAKSDFISSLEYFWNSWACGRHDIMLIVCGSATSWMMNKLINNHGGLHNRLTNRLFLKPFTLHETRLMLEAQGFFLSTYEIAECYMILGGVPFYLSLLTPEKSLAQNIDDLLFATNGYLRYEINNLYAALFKKSTDYLAIIEALTHNKAGLTREGIKKQANLSSGGGLTTMLNNLEACGFIRKYTYYDVNRSSVLYQLIDFFTLFHYSFLSDGQGQDQHYWESLQDSPRFYAWIGTAFEMLMLIHVTQIKEVLGISGVITSEFAWKSHELGAQIDLIIDRNDKTATICEAKFSQQPYHLDKEEEAKLRLRMAAARAIPKLARKSLQLLFLTSFGLAQGSYAGCVQKVIQISDLI